MMKIHCSHQELVNINELKPHPMNRNDHPKDQVKRLAKILEYQGWRYPIKVSKRSGFITSGHGRVEAARLNKWKEVPVDYQDYDSDEQEYADVQSDNAIASWAELDLSTINSDIQDLGPDFDIDLLGIKDFVLEPAEKFEAQCDEDEIPEQVEPKTKIGDIYTLGQHRLMCGDSTSIDAVEKLMAGKKADMVFTDPPYNIDYQGVKDKRDKIANDKMSEDDFLDFLQQSVYSAPIMYVCCSWQFAHVFKLAMYNMGRAPKAMIVWDKVNPAQHLDRYFKQHEIIFYHGPFGGNKTLRGDIWQMKRQQNTVHPTMKPVELVEMALGDNPDAKTVYDGFGGSGSTLIACEKTNRKCFMMELDPYYCDVIIARWEKYTGKMAELLNG